MKIAGYICSIVFILTGGCTQNPALSNPEVVTSSARPKPADIIDFKANLVPSKGHFKHFKVGRNDIEEVLSKWYQVSQEHWQHGYSHVAFGDKTGTIKLKDGRSIRWMVRPGGLAELAFEDGTTIYLARELTPWKNESDKTEVAYAFLLKKVQGDNINLIAAKDDKNLRLIQKIINENKLNLKVENYIYLVRGADLCYYSKRTKETVAIIDVTEKSEKSYYVSYYTGPEGGASKEIMIEKRVEKWIVMNDDERWNIK